MTIAMKPDPLILYVITDLELGGVPLHLLRLATAMRSRGFRVQVVSLAPIGPVGRMLADAGFEVQSCEGCCGLDFRVISRLAEVAAECSPDIVHSLLFHANQAARLVAALGGFPSERIVAEIQTVEVERRWHLLVDRLTHRMCRLTVGNSESVIDHLNRNAKIPMDRLRVIPGGIDVERIESAVRAGRSGTAHQLAKTILWVGRLDPVKGLDLLLRAMTTVIRAVPDARLRLVGDGPERKRLEDLAASMSLGPRLEFLGARNDVPVLLATCDLFVFPSRTEGLPNALLEAMAAGLPIVTTDVPGCRDLIKHEVTGLRVPYGDTSALAQAMVRMLNDAALAARLGASARSDARNSWSIAQTWNRYEALYREVLKSQSASGT